MNSRKIKGACQKLFLIENISANKEFEKKFRIMGSTGNVYNVTIKDIPECTCPDFRMRGSRCKHIYFVLIKLMKTDNQDEEVYEEKDLKIMFDNIPNISENLIVNDQLRGLYKKILKEEVLTEEERESAKEFNLISGKKLVENEMCPVCLEDLNDGTELDYCKFSCGKSIHKICFSMWCKRKKETCVYCRADWKIASISKGGGYLKYTNLLNTK
jgi:hypothetical protein